MSMNDMLRRIVDAPKSAEVSGNFVGVRHELPECGRSSRQHEVQIVFAKSVQ